MSMHLFLSLFPEEGVEVERLGGSEGKKEVDTEEGMERPPQCESTTDYTFSILFPSLTNQVEA